MNINGMHSRDELVKNVCKELCTSASEIDSYITDKQLVVQGSALCYEKVP